MSDKPEAYESAQFECAFCGKSFWTLYYEGGDQDQAYCDEHEERVREIGYAAAVDAYLATGKQMHRDLQEEHDGENRPSKKSAGQIEMALPYFK